MGRTVDVGTFVAGHEGPLLRTAYLLTGDPRSAEELVVTALTRTHRPWRRRGGGGDPAAAVRRTMVRTLVRQGDRPAADRSGTAGQPSDDTGPPPPDGSTAELRRALLDLPPRTRAALVLRLHDALTEAETADVLGCSSGTVAALTGQATATLRGRGLGRPPPPAIPWSSAAAAGGQPDDDAIYRRPR